MKPSRNRNTSEARRWSLAIVGIFLVMVAVILGLWWYTGLRKSEASGRSTAAIGVLSPIREKLRADGAEAGGSRVREGGTSGSRRQPLQFRGKPVEAAAVLGVLASGPATVEERVRQLQGMRGISLSKDERDSALEFLSGREVPGGMRQASIQWLADELLTVLRMQEPADSDLAAAMGKAAFEPTTDPVVRDYLMQHLGHLWEQSGAQVEIEAALWKAVGTSDETTPGTALIALSRGYERDGRERDLEEVRRRALALAENPNTGLAVRVTALSIAGESGEAEVRTLATGLAENAETPVILKKVAERVVGR